MNKFKTFDAAQLVIFEVDYYLTWKDGDRYGQKFCETFGFSECDGQDIYYFTEDAMAKTQAWRHCYNIEATREN